MKAFYSVIPALAISIAFYSGTPVVKSNTTTASIQKSTNAPGCTFGSFRAHRQGKGVSLTWSAAVSGPITFSVEKTYSDPSDPYSMWEVVSDQPGNGARSYKASDDFVYPGYSNYRISAIAGDGSVVACSAVETVRIVSR